MLLKGIQILLRNLECMKIICLFTFPQMNQPSTCSIPSIRDPFPAGPACHGDRSVSQFVSNRCFIGHSRLTHLFLLQSIGAVLECIRGQCPLTAWLTFQILQDCAGCSLVFNNNFIRYPAYLIYLIQLGQVLYYSELFKSSWSVRPHLMVFNQFLESSENQSFKYIGTHYLRFVANLTTQLQ